jgi:hypothetical protein
VDMFIEYILDIVDPRRELSPEAVVKLVSDKFTSNSIANICKCGSVAIYHHCLLCWCMEIDAQKNADVVQCKFHQPGKVCHPDFWRHFGGECGQKPCMLSRRNEE